MRSKTKFNKKRFNSRKRIRSRTVKSSKRIRGGSRKRIRGGSRKRIRGGTVKSRKLKIRKRGGAGGWASAEGKKKRKEEIIKCLKQSLIIVRGPNSGKIFHRTANRYFEQSEFKVWEQTLRNKLKSAKDNDPNWITFLYEISHKPDGKTCPDHPQGTMVFDFIDMMVVKETNEFHSPLCKVSCDFEKIKDYINTFRNVYKYDNEAKKKLKEIVTDITGITFAKKEINPKLYFNTALKLIEKLQTFLNESAPDFDKSDVAGGSNVIFRGGIDTKVSNSEIKKYIETIDNNTGDKIISQIEKDVGVVNKNSIIKSLGMITKRYLSNEFKNMPKSLFPIIELRALINMPEKPWKEYQTRPTREVLEKRIYGEDTIHDTEKKQQKDNIYVFKVKANFITKMAAIINNLDAESGHKKTFVNFLNLLSGIDKNSDIPNMDDINIALTTTALFWFDDQKDHTIGETGGLNMIGTSILYHTIKFWEEIKSKVVLNINPFTLTKGEQAQMQGVRHRSDVDNKAIAIHSMPHRSKVQYANGTFLNVHYNNPGGLELFGMNLSRREEGWMKRGEVLPAKDAYNIYVRKVTKDGFAERVGVEEGMKIILIDNKYPDDPEFTASGGDGSGHGDRLGIRGEVGKYINSQGDRTVKITFYKPPAEASEHGQPKRKNAALHDEPFTGFEGSSETNNGDYLIINFPPNSFKSLGMSFNLGGLNQNIGNKFLVTKVTKDSPADIKKVKVGMQIVEVNDVVATDTYSTPKELSDFIKSTLNNGIKFKFKYPVDADLQFLRKHPKEKLSTKHAMPATESSYMVMPGEPGWTWGV